MAASDGDSSSDTGKAISSSSETITSCGGFAGSGTYTPDQFRSEFRGPVAGGSASMNNEVMNEPLHVIYDGSGKMVNDKQTLTYTPPSPADLIAMYKQSVGRGAVSTDKRPYVPCNQCSKDHPRCSYCPYRPHRPCKLCYKPHDPSHCPYSDHIPQGATFNQASYEIVCACGNQFNVDKWVCTFCGGSKAVVKPKYCSICKSLTRHASYECPKDRVLAAEYKSLRDESLTAGPRMIPYEVYIPQRRESYSSDEDDFP